MREILYALYGAGISRCLQLRGVVQGAETVGSACCVQLVQDVPCQVVERLGRRGGRSCVLRRRHNRGGRCRGSLRRRGLNPLCLLNDSLSLRLLYRLCSHLLHLAVRHHDGRSGNTAGRRCRLNRRIAAAAKDHDTGVADGGNGIERRLTGDIFSLRLSERTADHDHGVFRKGRKGKQRGAECQTKQKRKYCFLIHGKNSFSSICNLFCIVTRKNRIVNKR